MFNDPGKTDGIFFLDAVYLTEPATQIHSPQSFFYHCFIRLLRKGRIALLVYNR